MRIRKYKVNLLGMLMLLSGIVACTSEKIETVEAIEDRTKMPVLDAYDITTVISDSGIIRYRIHTQKWKVFDKAPEPYWEFPLGIRFERFNTAQVVDANVRSNYARYYDKKQLWDLRGDVKIININGRMFESERLFWNQKTERIYSDTAVTITDSTKILKGLGFESDQEMKNPRIKKMLGTIVFKEEAEKEEITDTTKNIL